MRQSLPLNFGIDLLSYIGWPASFGDLPVSTSPGLGLQIPYLAFCTSTRDLNPSLHPGISPARTLHTRKVVSILFPYRCYYARSANVYREPQEQADVPTTADADICCLCGGSHLSSLPRQSWIHTGFSGNPAPGHRAHREADLRAPTWSHFQLLSPWREDSQGNVPPANLSLADCLSSQPRHAAHPFFLCHSATELISSHGSPIL